MDSHANLHAPQTSGLIRPLAGFRVMARDSHRRQTLLSMAESWEQAVSLAKALWNASNEAARPEGAVETVVEKWVGTLTGGWWEPVRTWRCRYQNSYRRHRPARNGQAMNGQVLKPVPPTPAQPKAGDSVQCVLLGEKTRKGGWRARLVGGDMEGPIVNSGDVSPSARAGQTATLCVSAIASNGKTIQFRW